MTDRLHPMRERLDARNTALFAFSIAALTCACSAAPPKVDQGANAAAESSGSGHLGDPGAASGRGDLNIDIGGSSGGEEPPSPNAVSRPELWYSSGDILVYLAIAKDGTLARIVASSMVGLPRGQNSITMLPSGALLGARLSQRTTTFYTVATPPREASVVVPEILGVMPEEIQVEALYTDCAGRIYAMDTGVNDYSAAGNRLLRFVGVPLRGDFQYEVVTDLGRATVADIDDLGPGVAEDDQTITDNPGIAIDTGKLYEFDYTTGTGTEAGHGGTFGVHALGGPLFMDSKARVYVLDSSAQLYLYDRRAQKLSAALCQGPEPTPGTADSRGQSGLAGPLSDCVSAFPPIVR